MNKMYHCGKRGCPGHHSQYEQCLFDTINFEIPKIDKMPDFGTINFEIPKIDKMPKIRLSDVLEKLEKYYCGKRGCPGHLVKGEQCINW